MSSGGDTRYGPLGGGLTIHIQIQHDSPGKDKESNRGSPPLPGDSS